MKLGDTLVKALKERDTDVIGRIVEYMRFGLRDAYSWTESVHRNHRETYEYVCRICQKRGVKPPDMPEWDELLRESEGG